MSNNQWVVFGGWACGPGILKPVFGDDAVYVDCNLLMQSIVENELLQSDWIDRVASHLRPIFPRKRFNCAGWSTGSFFAYTIGIQYHCDTIALLSATPSFCRRDSFRFGTRASVLQTMRQNLVKNPTETLKQFFTRCGSDSTKRLISKNYSTACLCAGLQFLEQCSLLPLGPVNTDLRFFHGKQDEIVPVHAGEYFAQQCGGKFFPYPGSHLFFPDQADGILSQLKF